MRLVLFLVLMAASGAASIRSGMRAYNRGDFTTAFRDWSAVAARGDGDAQYHLALLYRDGQGVGRDPHQAFDLLGRSAWQGFGPAQVEYGWFFEKGFAGPIDYSQARDWYAKAAAQGNPGGINDLGLLYMNGRGVPRDYAKAREYFERASRFSAPAMANRALLYEMGWGVARNPVEACALYTVAAERGSKLAPAERDAVCGSLDAANRKLADRRLSELRWQRAGYWLRGDGRFWTVLFRNFSIFGALVYLLVRYNLLRLRFPRRPAFGHGGRKCP